MFMADNVIPEPATPLLPATSDTADTAGQRQSHLILVIDDDQDVLESLQRLLVSEGCAVQAASNPTEGIAFYEGHWREVELVVLDFFMPKLRGDEVFERLQQINPNVCAILTTACDDGVAKQMLDRGLHGFLQKPFAPQDFINRVHNAMNCTEQFRATA
jgi:CheY-like chemotaxis protein